MLCRCFCAQPNLKSYPSKATSGSARGDQVVQLWCFTPITLFFFFLQFLWLQPSSDWTLQWKPCVFTASDAALQCLSWRWSSAPDHFNSFLLHRATQRGELTLITLDLPTRGTERCKKPRREQERGRIQPLWESVYHSSPFYKPLGRKWGGGHPLT